MEALQHFQSKTMVGGCLGKDVVKFLLDVQNPLLIQVFVVGLT